MVVRAEPGTLLGKESRVHLLGNMHQGVGFLMRKVLVHADWQARTALQLQISLGH